MRLKWSINEKNLYVKKKNKPKKYIFPEITKLLICQKKNLKFCPVVESQMYKCNNLNIVLD